MKRASPHRGRRPIRQTAAPAILVLPLVLVCAQVEGIPGDPERAELLVRQGREMVGQPAEARSYAERALEFVEDDPDAHALLGEAAVAEGRYDTAAQELELAARADVLHVYTGVEVRQTLARALIRMRRYVDALAVLGELGPGSEAETLVLAARAAGGLGRQDQARRILLDATRVHPERADAWLALAEAERALNHFGDSRAALEAGRSRHPMDPAILLSLVTEERTPEARASRLGAYFALSDRPPRIDAQAAVLGARYDTAQIPLYVERFLRADGLRYGELLSSLAAELASSPDAAAIREAQRTWTGLRTRDVDGDGVPEYRYVYEGGMLRMWGADLDQDGFEEAVVTLDQGETKTVMLRGLGDLPVEGASLQVDYGTYPWVTRAELATPSTSRVYELVPQAFRLRVLSPDADTPELPPEFRPPRESEIRAASSAYRDYRMPERRLVSSATLRDGSLVRVEGDADGDGRSEHVVHYRDGAPEGGERDLDSDGVFETRETYASGQLQRLEIDTNRDGRADYVWRKGDPGMESWDLDADGELDVERSATVLVSLRRLYGSITGSMSR